MNKVNWYIDGTTEMFEGYDWQMPLFDEDQVKVVAKRFGLKLNTDDMYEDRPGEIIGRPIRMRKENKKYYVFSLDWLWCKAE